VGEKKVYLDVGAMQNLPSCGRSRGHEASFRVHFYHTKWVHVAEQKIETPNELTLPKRVSSKPRS